jgi:hypothetical protein
MSDDTELRQDIAFARWWDDLFADRATRPDAELDGHLALFARRVHGLEQPVVATDDYRRRLWERLMLGSSPARAPRGREGQLDLQARPARVAVAQAAEGISRGWRGAALVAASGLLIAVAASMIFFVAGRDDRAPSPSLLPTPDGATPAPVAMFTGKEWTLGAAFLTTDFMPAELESTFHATLLELRISGSSSGVLNVAPAGR